ncbi:uncharacterized protein EI90DRAFT_3065848 [Cantharellus anzutake]|uniref:uncharacterized protein n=1 Tax=Cantharellus anzutake TaxID=1750568 RepID=UPI001902FD73|nr:uncharacterized protein EI90DRAFT_3065848 [Cantharellus anzutake]KAF8328191.1 hypothetical protein EI90DRAFT_3065848 [Cantharellus anzutake]
MQAFRNYGSIREAPGSSSGAQAPIPSISLHEEPTIGSVQNDDGYFGIEGLQDHQPEELARVSYAQLIRSYSLVPICSLLFLILMALIPTLWEGPMQKGRSPSVFNMMVAFAAWVISYGFKTPSHNLATGFGRWVTDTSVALGVLISTILQEATRLFGLVISSLTFALDVNNGNQSLPLNTDSPLFRQVWWYALGWAAGIELYGIAQGYFQLVAYKDVLEEDAPSDEESDLMGETMTTRSEGRRYISSVLKSPPEENNPEQNTQAALTRLSVAFPSTGTPMSAYLDEEMARLLAIRTRAELEQVYGIPPPVRSTSFLQYKRLIATSPTRTYPCLFLVSKDSIPSSTHSALHSSSPTVTLLS